MDINDNRIIGLIDPVVSMGWSPYAVMVDAYESFDSKHHIRLLSHKPMAGTLVTTVDPNSTLHLSALLVDEDTVHLQAGTTSASPFIPDDLKARLKQQLDPETYEAVTGEQLHSTPPPRPYGRKRS